MFQRVYPGQGIGYEATCAAAGTVCRNPPTALKLNGQRITSQYLCSQHIRCQAVDNGTRCNLDVKDGNSALYRYCTPLREISLAYSRTLLQQLTTSNQTYVRYPAARLNGRGITVKTWRFATSIAASTTTAGTIKMPSLLKELIQMTLNASVSDIVTARNHNAGVSVTSPKSNSESKQTCTGCVQATTIDEAVVDEQNEAHDSVDTIFASVLYRNVTDPGKLRSTDLPRAMLTDSSATDTAAGKLAATTRLQWDQGGA
ncbi:hypothetical protein MRS44_000372 [Fusarium solani]|uniref:uncharacterized protein n=1 Tax=Fusarium solani TaxID=169388 RepID=UPI0032C3DEB7|nr:hypothetical protein MRS44_000372 [Fusarium solani]